MTHPSDSSSPQQSIEHRTMQNKQIEFGKYRQPTRLQPVIQLELQVNNLQRLSTGSQRQSSTDAWLVSTTTLIDGRRVSTLGRRVGRARAPRPSDWAAGSGHTHTQAPVRSIFPIRLVLFVNSRATSSSCPLSIARRTVQLQS